MIGAIESFAASLRANLLGENFSVTTVTWIHEGDMEAFAADASALAGEACAKALEASWPEGTVSRLRACFPDRHSSGFIASFAFALHLFRIAEDNWFNYDGAREASAWFAEKDLMSERRELFLLKGVDARELLPGLCVPPDLALVADFGTREVGFILIGLAD